MFYREAGEYKTSYQADQATFPIAFDFWRFWIVMAIALVVGPMVATDYMSNAIFLPFFVYAMAALGLNILTGYCGQVSLGTGGFMAVGAYAAYKFMTGIPEIGLPALHIVPVLLLAGLTTAFVGILFGLPSLRIKGFYLAVATLAAQFFLIWLFNKWGWAYNYSASGQISAPETYLWCFETREALSVNAALAKGWTCPAITGANTLPGVAYLFCFALLFVFCWIARNLVRGRLGRSWMAIRDMDIAAEIIGVNPLGAKLSAFAVSSFYVGIAGAMYFMIWKGAAEGTEAFPINTSFNVLFMVIIGGLGSIFGSLIGAAFITVLPVFLKLVMVDLVGWPTDLAEYFRLIIVGGLIIFFLIVEPHGIAALWRTAKEKLRLWPFPH